MIFDTEVRKRRMKIVIAGNGIIEQSKQVSKFDFFCFWFATIDLLFLPYFTLVSVSYSVPIIVIWMAMHINLKLNDRENMVAILIEVAMVFSTALSMIYTEELRFETTFFTSFKRLLQYIICFGYYFFYKTFFKKVKVNLNKILLSFVLFVTLFAIFFLANPQLYADIKFAINPADNHTKRYLADMVVYRFNYWWTDPNNIAYLIVGVLWWGVLRKEMGIFLKFLLSILSILIVTSTVSNGGLIMLITMFIFMFFKWLFTLIMNGRVKKQGVIFVISIAVFLLFIIKTTNMFEYLFELFIVKIQTRFQFYSSTRNLSGGRLNDVKLAMKYFNPLFLILGVGKEGFTTENGHLYWIGMYGFPAYIGVIWLMFRKLKKQNWIDYIWIIPFFACFTMNIGIGEFKWMAIFFMLLSYSRYGQGIEVYGNNEHE